MYAIRSYYAGFNPTSVQEQLNIFVFNFSSIRINSRKKDDRKVYEQNGALEQFRGFVDNDLVIEDTDETALINVIRSLNPVVVVDESVITSYSIHYTKLYDILFCK